MKEYLYVFKGPKDSMSKMSTEVLQAHMQRWGAWMKALGEQGKFVKNLPLESGGSVVHNGGEVIKDFSYGEGNEIVGGYLIIKADGLDEAVQLSKDCPIFETGGNIEVRPVVDMSF